MSAPRIAVALVALAIMAVPIAGLSPEQMTRLKVPER
jgi:hypothetical protein